MTQSIQKDALLAQFSELAYRSRAYLDSNPSAVPAGWTVVRSKEEGSFAAFAFRNDATGEVVVAYRGTDGLNDAGAGLSILGGTWNPQFQAGMTFMADLRNDERAYPGGYDPAKTLVTGHSLGGAMAQVVSQAYGLDGAAMDPGAAARIVQTDGFRAATERAGLPAGGNGMPSTFKNWLVAGSVVSHGTGDQLGGTSYLPSLTFTGQQALTAFVIGMINPAAGIGYAVAVDQFSNKHPSSQISNSMNLLAGIGGDESTPSPLTLSPKIVSWDTNPSDPSGPRVPRYSQTEFEVRDSSGALQSELKFSGSKADRKLEVLSPTGELKSTISVTEGGSLVQVNAVRQPSIEIRVLPETSYNADGSVTAITRGTDGQVLSTAVTRVADDGSRLTVIEFANGMTRYVSVNSDEKSDRVLEVQTVGNQTISRLYDETGTKLVSQTVSEIQPDGSEVITESNADGSYRTTKLDAEGHITDTREVGPVAAAMERQTPVLQDVTSLLNALRSGDDLLIGGSGIKLINDVASLSGANVPYLGATNAVLQGVVSLYNLDKAFQQDNDLVKLQATLGAVTAVNAAASAVYVQVATHGLTGEAAQLAAQRATQEMADTALGTAAKGASTAIPYLAVVYDLKEGNYTGAAVGMAGIAGVPYVGWIYAAYMLISALSNTPPEAWGTAVYKFGDGTEVNLDVVGEAFGPSKVRLLMEGSGTPGQEGYFPGLLGYLNQRIASLESADPNQQLGIIPQRLPRVTWREARQGDPGYAIVDIDPLTGEQRNAFLRYNDDFSPYNADPTDPIQRQNVFERMIASALERGAIAPMWEVQTAKLQQDAHDPNAGLTEEERAAKRGELAPIDPTKPNERMGTFRPVVLDLNGDNTITTVANADTTRAFDWDDTGYLKQTGWVGNQEGLLFLDRNPNGAVDSGRELFSNGLVSDAARGVRSISWVDANADGVINASDPVFAQMKVWQDLDGDGRSGEFSADGTFVNDEGEVHTLAELGITELNYGASRFTRDGQQFSMQSPELEADDEGMKVSPNPAGIRIDFSNGDAKIVVTQVVGLEAGNDLVPNQFEDGSNTPRSTPIAISIDAGLLLQNDQLTGTTELLTIQSVLNAAHGSVSYDAATGEVLFTPEANFHGDASFDYVIAGPGGVTRTASVTIPLADVGDPPTATYELNPPRAIYGWEMRSQIDYGGESGGSTARIFDAGSPIYEPFESLRGYRITTIGAGASALSTVSSVLEDSGARPQAVIDAHTLASNWYAVNHSGTGGYSAPYVDIGSFRFMFEGRGNPTGGTVTHDQPVAWETANDGRILAASADADGGAPGSFRFDVVTQGLYGSATVDPNTGEFSYVGKRYVDYNLDGTYVNANVTTDQYTRTDEVFTDSFVVRVFDLNDPTGSTFVDETVEVPHYGPRPSANVASGGKPIAIDLNGDGFHFTDVDDSNVFFDVNGDGWRRRIAWPSASDGLLAFDRDDDGTIERFDEISFVPYAPDKQTDLEALKAAFDTNHDGLLSNADEAWNQFGVWQDANQNGVTDAGEFRSLTELGIDRIELTSNGQFQVVDGQTVHGTATATRTDGTQVAVADVTLNVKNETQVPTANGGTSVVALPAYQPGQDLVGTDDKDLALGTSGNDTYKLGAGDDVLMDDGGNDAVEAGDGNDVVYTGNDNDYVDAGSGDDTVYAGNGNDMVVGGAGNDLILTEGGNDIAFGADGDDFIAGGDGNDVLSGDRGDDRLFGESGSDALLGQDGNDELWGMGDNDLLYGQDGDDLLAGGAGDDVMEGGAGNDIYEVDSASDVVTELAGEGTDTVRSSISYALADTVENLTLTGTASLSGTGNVADNVLVGNDGNNVLIGLAGNDLLDGGLGADTMTGGTGDDTYRVDDAGDQVVEAANEGQDTVESRISYTLGEHVEDLTLIGLGNIDGTGNVEDNVLVGNNSANALDGKEGADRLQGRGGNDRYTVDNVGDQVVEAEGEGYDSVTSHVAAYALTDHVEALILGAGAVNGSGNGLANLLVGNDADNRLDGGAGADLMIGGQGNDTYVVDSADDQTSEAADAGVDSVLATVDWTLAAHVENLVLQGAARSGSGNELDNHLTGNDQANTLDGAVGADVMMGGRGDDTYVVDNAQDQTVESAGEGVDTVRSSVDWALADQVENLVLTGTAVSGTGNDLQNALSGNAQANVLDGGAGIDSMSGGAGDDTYRVDESADVVVESAGEGDDLVVSSADYTLSANVERLTLVGSAVRGTGNTQDNTLLGNGLTNLLDGQSGADHMAGGQGDDTYIVDNQADQTIEMAGEGTDTVLASVTFAAAANVENLTLTGTADIDASGNELANVLVGNAGANALHGGAGSDTLRGGAGNDLLDGGSGSDTMFGEAGDDGYVVDEAGDLVIEASAQGFDRVAASIDYVLPQHVEQLTLTGAAVKGSGNELDNLLFGNTQANQLDGGAGADAMAGGAGDDRYTVDHVGDTVVETIGEGVDTVYAGVSYATAANVENLILTGASNLTAVGNELANVLVGNSGANTLTAGSGNDVLAGGLGNDTLDGGSGNDLYLYNQGEGRDTLQDAAGTDTLRFGTGVTLDSLAGRVINVNGQSRVFISVLGTDGQETTQGIEVALDAAGKPVVETLQFADGSSVTFDKVMVTGRTLNGTWGNDSLQGDRRDDTINADWGNDTVYARWGNDVVYGSYGNDRLFGEGGNDRLYGEADQDQLFGGAGDDLLDGGSGDDVLAGGAGQDKLYGGSGNDTLDGGAGDDLLEGNSGNDGLYAGAGNDILRGSSGSDVLAAGDGDDVIDAGGGGWDVIVAGAGNDRIDAGSCGAAFVDAGAGSDIIVAGSGSDFVAGGQGNDQIDAGAGSDVFAFNRGDGADSVSALRMTNGTLSLGGGIRYQDISLRKEGDNLVLSLGQGDSVTLTGWYKPADLFGWFHHDDLETLQVVTEGGDYNATSSNRLLNRKIVQFDFDSLAARFDAARAANPNLTTWTVTTAELDRAYLSGSNSYAMGGDLAYRYATTGSYGDLGTADVQQRVSTMAISDWTTLKTSTMVNPWTALQAGISLVPDQTVGLPSPITPADAPDAAQLQTTALLASSQRPGWLS